MLNNKFNTSDIIKICQKKAEIIERRDNKHIIIWVGINGIKVSRVTIPHGKKILPPKTYKSIAENLKLSVSEFDSFLDCSLSKENYLNKLKPYLSE